MQKFRHPFGRYHNLETLFAGVQNTYWIFSLSEGCSRSFSLSFFKYLMVEFEGCFRSLSCSTVETSLYSASRTGWYWLICSSISSCTVSCSTGCHTAPKHNSSTPILSSNAAPFFFSSKHTFVDCCENPSGSSRCCFTYFRSSVLWWGHT